MLIYQKILSIILILLVFTSQSLAAESINFCDMDMQVSEHSSMDQSEMDCCNDDLICAMDCSISMASMVSPSFLFEAENVSSEKIISPQNTTIIRSLTSLFRPPIFS